jgi:hypothetical protein
MIVIDLIFIIIVIFTTIRNSQFKLTINGAVLPKQVSDYALASGQAYIRLTG